jgi:hypothetical protein
MKISIKIGFNAQESKYAIKVVYMKILYMSLIGTTHLIIEDSLNKWR